MTKLVKKKKIKVFSLLILIIIVAIVGFLAYKYITANIKNIIIEGNNYVNDEEVLEQAELTEYKSFLTILPSTVEKKLTQNKYIKEVEVKRNFFTRTLTIKIKEYDILFYNNNNNKYVLDNNKTISSNKNIRVPTLINYVPDEKYKKLITALHDVDKSVLGKISEISYNPNEFDKDRFLLLMDDGNSVFLTLTKFEMINHYNDVLGQLEGRKGILYLDSGNHFKIME